MANSHYNLVVWLKWFASSYKAGVYIYLQIPLQMVLTGTIVDRERQQAKDWIDMDTEQFSHPESGLFSTERQKHALDKILQCLSVSPVPFRYLITIACKMGKKATKEFIMKSFSQGFLFYKTNIIHFFVFSHISSDIQL